jgi:hypothetical protein
MNLSRHLPSCGITAFPSVFGTECREFDCASARGGAVRADRDDQHVPVTRLIDQAIRKAAKRPLPQVIEQDRSAPGRLRDLQERPLQRASEAAGNAGSILVDAVPAASGLRLARGCGMPSQLNHPTR